MIVSEVKPIATRAAFGQALADLGHKDPQVVVLDADLSVSTKSCVFRDQFPKRFFEMGIAEANMIGTASGLALCGKKPFICSFACFVTGRYDIIRISVAYSNANVKIVGSHAGVAIGPDGFSQMGLEDISLMRALPNMAVFQPCDDIETEQLIQFLGDYHGPAYIRLTRQNLPRLHDNNYRFQMNQADIIQEGSDISLIASGSMVEQCLLAAQSLAPKGIQAEVINISTIKPIDQKTIIQSAQKTGKVITAEDHSVIGGLGSAVAEVLSEKCPVPMQRIGIQDVFGQSGDPDELYEYYQLSSRHLANQIETFLNQHQSKATFS